MGGVFGKSKKQPSRITEQDKAVLVSKTIKITNNHIPCQSTYL